MKVIVDKSFYDINHGSFKKGDVTELPKGVDWVKAGFVSKIQARKRKTKEVISGDTD